MQEILDDFLSKVDHSTRAPQLIMAGERLAA